MQTVRNEDNRQG